MLVLRKLGFAVAAMLLGILVPLALVEILLRFLPVRSGAQIQPVTDTAPIAHFRPSSTYVYSAGWNFRNVNRGKVNNYGFINDQDYSPSGKSPLLMVIGDSFVEALMVPYEQTLQARLARKVGSGGRVWSMGVSGAPLAQYLAYAGFAATEFHPSGIVIPVVGNDFDESLLKYKSAPSLHYFREESDGNLKLTHVNYDAGPLRKLVRWFALSRYLILNMEVASIASFERRPAKVFVGNTDASTDAQRVTDSKRAVDAFLDQLPATSKLEPAKTLFLVDALRPQLYNAAELEQARGSYFGVMRAYFMEAARAKGFEVADMEPEFLRRYQQAHQRFEFTTDNHWNAVGHAAAAEVVQESKVFQMLWSR